MCCVCVFDFGWVFIGFGYDVRIGGECYCVFI